MGDQHPLSLVQAEHPSISFIAHHPLDALRAVEINSQEFLLVFSTLAIYVDYQGRKSREKEIMYPAPPLAIGKFITILPTRFASLSCNGFFFFPPFFNICFMQFITMDICWFIRKLMSTSLTVSRATGCRRSIWNDVYHLTTMASCPLASLPNSLTSFTYATSTKVLFFVLFDFNFFFFLCQLIIRIDGWKLLISVCDAVNVPESEITLGGQSRAGSNQPRTRRRFSVRENNRTSKPAYATSEFFLRSPQIWSICFFLICTGTMIAVLKWSRRRPISTTSVIWVPAMEYKCNGCWIYPLWIRRSSSAPIKAFSIFPLEVFRWLVCQPAPVTRV